MRMSFHDLMVAARQRRRRLPMRDRLRRRHRLVELGLKAKTKAAARADRAKELATKAIEKIIDPTAPPEERAQRRRHLTKGPEEFREVRVDRPKAKK